MGMHKKFQHKNTGKIYYSNYLRINFRKHLINSQY